MIKRSLEPKSQSLPFASATSLGILSACLISSGSPIYAQGNCPTGADLKRGIEFKISGGDAEVYKESGSNQVEVLYSAPDGYQSRILLGKGIYLMEFVELVDGAPDASSRTSYSHSLEPTNMPEPKPGGRWVSDAEVSDGGSGGREIHNHSFGQLTEVTIGACSYEMMPIKVIYDDSDETIDYLEYIPSLGLAYLAGTSSVEDDERTEEIYSYYSISVVQGSGNTGGKKGKKSE